MSAWFIGFEPLVVEREVVVLEEGTVIVLDLAE